MHVPYSAEEDIRMQDEEEGDHDVLEDMETEDQGTGSNIVEEPPTQTAKDEKL